jgi:cytochrome b involved in lipid metabolism
MTTGKLVTAVCAVVVLVGTSYFVVSSYAKNAEEKQAMQFEDNQSENTRVTEGAFAPQMPKEVDDSAETPDEVEEANTASEDSTPEPASLYTKATVATHNSESSCWTIINRNVYDLTSFVSKHPGGDRNILKICGIDGTSAFTGQHGGDSRPESTLEKYLLGPLEN